MGLSSDLISQFVKVTNDSNKSKKESTAYGTVRIGSDGSEYVQLDGSEILTPVTSTAGIKDGDRVIVMLKNHTATVTGNLTDPSARSTVIDEEMLRVEKIISESLQADKAAIEELQAQDVAINGKLDAANANISNLATSKLDASVANITFATIKDLDATNAYIHNLETTYGDFMSLTTDNFSAINATIEGLNTQYANIDFSNIGKAAMEHFYASSGLIKDVVVENETITGELVGVTIRGDRIIADTIVAEKLVIEGEDGLYYRLNAGIDGVTQEQLATEEYQSKLHGENIIAKTITASKINVSDLVAFGATIGGFNITENSIYSGVKETIDNWTRGVYIDNDGQFCFGDSSNFIKGYKWLNNTYELGIKARYIYFGTELTDLNAFRSETINDMLNIDKKADDAAKTATNFLSYDATNGLQLGNNTSGSWDGLRAQILPSAYNILNQNGDVLASYGEKLIELGKDDSEAVISLCGDLCKIEYDANDEYLQLYGSHLRLNGLQSAALYCNYYDGASIGSKSYVETYIDQVIISSSDSQTLDPETGVGSWRTSSISVRPDGISIISDSVTINGVRYNGSKVLWHGSYQMSASQTVVLSEPVSVQTTGIVLVFSRYSSSTTHNYHFSTHFVPKGQIIMHGGCGHTFTMTTDGTFSLYAAKYLYLRDTTITGSDVNGQSGTGACGINYANNGFVLRYVIGV